MGINTLTPRYLNLDNDSRIVAAQEMIDALNVRVSADDGGNQGVVKNIAGNTDVASSLTLPSGDNKVVGAYEYEGSNRLFFFVHNSNNDHSILEYNNSTNEVDLLFQTSNISLSAESILHIDGVVYDDELMLYFTDGINEPQVINVDDIQPPTSKQQSAVAKVSPNAPTAVFSTDSSKGNNLLGRSFQFASQFVYRNGEVSAIGEYSEHYTALNTLNESIVGETYNSSYNKLTITLDFPSFGNTLQGQRVYYRDVMDNTMYYIGEFSPNATIDFYNDKSYPVISDSEYNKLQDAVPKTAQTQVISNNRLFYGNYTEGFDKQVVTATVEPSYSDTPSIAVMGASVVDTTTPRVNLSMDNINGNATLIDGSTDIEVVISFVVDDWVFQDSTQRSATLTVNNNLIGTDNIDVTFDYSDYEFFHSFTVTAPANILALRNAIIAELNGLTVDVPVNAETVESIHYQTDRYDVSLFGQSTWSLSASYSSGNIEIDFAVDSYDVDAKWATSTALSSNTVNVSMPINVASVTSFTTSGWGVKDAENSYAYRDEFYRTFKRNTSHSIGVVFEDDRSRTSGVYEIGDVYIDSLSETTNKGSVAINSTLSVSSPNSEFTSFFYVSSGSTTIEDYVQYSVAGAFEAVSTDDEKANADVFYLSLRTLQGKAQSYSTEGAADLTYSFTKGDKLRVLSYEPQEGLRTYPSEYVFEIVGLETFEDDTNLVGSGLSATGDFLVVKNREHGYFGKSSIGTSNSGWGLNPLVEIYTPKKDSEVKIYRACTPKYDISEIGNTQTLESGDAWYKRREIKFATNTNDLDSQILFVESNQYYDKDSLTKGDLGGKPYAVITNEKEYSRISSITYSEPVLQDSAQNNFSSFNNSLANFMDYEMNYGGIYGLVDSSDSITILQSDKVSRVPVSRNILTTAGGQDFVTQTNSVLGVQQSYGGNFGINEDRQAFLKAGSTIYLIDVTRSKIVALGSNGVKILSDMNVSSWVEERCDAMLEASSYSVSIGNDKKNSEIIFTLQDADNAYNKSIVYSSGLDKFTSFVSYSSDFYGNLGNRFLQVRGDDVYEAETNSIYGSFFGLQYDAHIKAVFNQNPTSRKVFNAVGVDGTANPSATVSTIDQSVSIPEGAFSLKEGVYYANVPKEEGTSQFVMLGAVRSESDPEITLESKVNRLPFKLGGDVYKLDSGVMTQITGVTVDSVVSSRVVSMTNAGAVAAGDVIGVKGESVDGDPVRGAYAEIQVDFNDATAFELFAISAHTSESGLHNNPQTQQ